MKESIAPNRTVGQRGQKVFRGFVCGTNDGWLRVAPTRSGERYVAIPGDAVLAVDTPDDDGPALVSIDASSTVYDVRERARPATDIEPSTEEEPDVLYMYVNPFRQLALLEQLKAASGGSLVVGDVDDDTLDEIIRVLEDWKRGLGRR